jgi:hypothetical protein
VTDFEPTVFMGNIRSHRRLAKYGGEPHFFSPPSVRVGRSTGPGACTAGAFRRRRRVLRLGGQHGANPPRRRSRACLGHGTVNGEDVRNVVVKNDASGHFIAQSCTPVTPELCTFDKLHGVRAAVVLNGFALAFDEFIQPFALLPEKTPACPARLSQHRTGNPQDPGALRSLRPE